MVIGKGSDLESGDIKGDITAEKVEKSDVYQTQKTGDVLTVDIEDVESKGKTEEPVGSVVVGEYVDLKSGSIDGDLKAKDIDDSTVEQTQKTGDVATVSIDDVESENEKESGKGGKGGKGSKGGKGGKGSKGGKGGKGSDKGSKGGKRR